MKIHFDHFKTERDGFHVYVSCFFLLVHFIKNNLLIFFLVNGENISARDLLLLCSTEKEQQ